VRNYESIDVCRTFDEGVLPFREHNRDDVTGRAGGRVTAGA
jgi:hypothetical protein